MSFLNKVRGAIEGGISGQELSIDGRRVTVGRKIADGGYGIIYEATDTSGRNYALKALQAPDEEHYQAIITEYETHKACASHPNVVKVFGMSANRASRQATILMELCPDSLVSVMNSRFDSGLDDRTIVDVFQSVCSAVEFMHSLSPPVIHRDLKPENVLRGEGRWKLCDFGSATRKIYTLKTSSERNEAADDLEKNTTALYRAPEMCDLFRRQAIGPKADVWALGCVLFKLCTFKDAFGEGSNLQILNKKYTWPPNRKVNDKFKELVKYMFETDPEDRPSARDVLGELYRMFPEWVDSKWAQEGGRPAAKAQSEGKFDPFGSGAAVGRPAAPPPRKAQPAKAEFNPFSGQQQAPPVEDSGATFDPFAQFQQQQQPATFNPFDQQPAAQPATFNPFGQQPAQQPTFNPFDQQKPAPASQPAPFNPFDQQPAAPSSQFNPFDQQPAAPASQPLFNPFEQQPQAVASPDPFAQGGQPAPVIINQDNPFGDSGAPRSSGGTAEVQDLTQSSTTSFSAQQIESNPEAVMNELLAKSDMALSSALFAVNMAAPSSTFLLDLLHLSGVNGPKIAQALPSVSGPMNALFGSRRTFSNNFPQYEGNFALTEFLRAHKDNPVPIGKPPICTEAAKELLSHIDKALTLLRQAPSKASGEEAFYVYQVTAFVLAKLKQAKINEGYVVNTAIPLFRNMHDQLKRAFANVKPAMNFPAEPFNFDDPNFLKRIRPPASKSVQ